MRGLTDRQSECLTIIEASIALRGYPPTLREIAQAMGITSTNGVNDHLRALERKQVISRAELKSRAIVLLGQIPPSVSEHDPRPPTPGQFVQRKRCLTCRSHTFADRCPYCMTALLEVA